jgi:GH15 family glucan-1,4-alpha-glucosidase
VLRCGWSERKQAFTQSYGSDELDASILLMPIVGFLPADDPRFVSTVEAIRRELSVDGLLRRYQSQDAPTIDGLPAGEGVFLACSFWLVEVLALQDRLEEAQALFDRLLGLRNDVGLLSEEYDPKTRALLGNFPQAFTHLALVQAALTLDERRSPRSVASK